MVRAAYLAMATPDGISDDDWNGIEDLARDAANATLSGDDLWYAATVEQLLGRLRILESKYGRRPSILATTADYLDDHREAVHLLETAYLLAERLDDAANMTYIASSLAQRYVDDLSDLASGRKWVDRLRRCLVRFPDDSECEVLRDLEARIESA